MPPPKSIIDRAADTGWAGYLFMTLGLVSFLLNKIWAPLIGFNPISIGFTIFWVGVLLHGIKMMPRDRDDRDRSAVDADRVRFLSSKGALGEAL